MMTAIAEPDWKSGTAPIITMYSCVATTVYCPPIEAGIPKSVKDKKKDKMKAAAIVPIMGRTLVM